MSQFETLDDILDFAIVQEKAAQKFYAKLFAEAEESKDSEKARIYQDLVEQERIHEEKLQKLRSSHTRLAAPDLTDLEKSGYLKALPLGPEMSLKEVFQYALKKEKSAKMLYNVLANNMPRGELADMFRMLASEESDHADYFRKEHKALCMKAN